MPTANFEWAAPGAVQPGTLPHDDPDATQEFHWIPGPQSPDASPDGSSDGPPDGTAVPRDTRTCPACGDQLATADVFCEACGAAVNGQDAAASPCAACGARSISPDGYCQYCGTRQPRHGDRVEEGLGAVAGVSDRGLRHRDNEDAMALWHDTGPHGVRTVAVVCDGVSSSDRPAMASRAAADAAAGVLAAAIEHGADPETASRSAVAHAFDAVAALEDPAAAQHGPDPTPPSCTFVSAVVTTTSVTVAWIGDSRAYWLADPSAGSPPAALLTEDDSWAAQMVAWGLMDESEAFTDPRAHALARWLGADAQDVEPRLVTFTPTGPGAVMLCSDGLWNYLPGAAELAAVALPGALTDPLAAARELVGVALDGGGRDNITVVVVPFPPTPDLPKRSFPQ